MGEIGIADLEDHAEDRAARYLEEAMEVALIDLAADDEEERREPYGLKNEKIVRMEHGGFFYCSFSGLYIKFN